MFWNLLLDTVTASPSPSEGTNPGGCGMPNYVMFIILGVLIVVLIAVNFLMNRKQKKQAQETMSKLKVGDTIVTIGGVKGTVVEIDESDDTVTVETGVGESTSTITFFKGAIQTVNPDKVNTAATTETVPEDLPEAEEVFPESETEEKPSEDADSEVSPEGVSQSEGEDADKKD